MESGDRPSLKDLHMLEVINTATSKWRELGIELLNADTCREIEVANKEDMKKSCSEMFRCWLKADLNASWKKLIAALKQPSVGLNTLALMLEEKCVEPTQVHFMSGKSLPPSFAEQKQIKKHDHVLLIINTSSQQHDGLRPLVQLLKRNNYVELTFTIDASHFTDSQTINDSIVEEFKQKIKEKVAKDAVVLVYIQGHTTCVYSNMDISRDLKMMFMGAIVIDKMDSNEMVYLLSHDIQTLLAELETDFLTIFLEGHYDHSLKSELIQSRKNDKKLTKNLSEHLKNMWMAMVPSQSRVVLLTTYPEFHVTTKYPCINLHDKITSVIEMWTMAGLLSQGSHREFYESISYLLYEEGRMSLGYIFIQGDKERQFCGKNYIPYEHWVAGNLSISQSENPLDREIVVVLGSLLEFKIDEEVVIFHLLQPTNKAYGKITQVTDQYCLVKMTDNDSSSLSSLVQDICKMKSLDLCHHFVSIKKVHKSLLKQKIPVDICISDKEVADELIADVARNAFLRVATERDIESVVIRKEVDRANSTYYVVVDQAKDVTQIKVTINNPMQLKVVLMHIAWFKYVKKLRKTKNILMGNLDYTCSATSEKKLLDPTLIPHKLEIIASSTLSPDNSELQSILQFTGPSRYWKPALDDMNSHLDINLKCNHNITAVELRGDAQTEEFIKSFDLKCRTFEFQSMDIIPGGKVPVESTSGATKSITATKVRIIMQNYNQFDKCKFRLMQHNISGTGMVPVTVNNADMPYTQDSNGWIEVLTGIDNPQLTVLFGFHEQAFLKQLQFEGKSRTELVDHKAAIKLQYISEWRREPMEGCSSVWPVKRELFSPMKAALVRIVPTSYNKYPALQLQLHGNPVHEGKAVEVFDNEQVTFYFCNNMDDSGLFFNVLCLEETGAVQLLLSEYVERNQSKKRIMEVFIQENHKCSSTVDTYKIYVSQRKPVLDTLMQDSLLDYEKPTSYSVYSFGYPMDDMMKDGPWDITDIPIHIKSSSKIYKS